MQKVYPVTNCCLPNPGLARTELGMSEGKLFALCQCQCPEGSGPDLFHQECWGAIFVVH